MGCNIATTVAEASKVVMLSPIRVYGDNQYTISTNFITWDNQNCYTLEDIAISFGTRKQVSQSPEVGGSTRSGFTCGNAVISAYDFGLLYTVFSAMLMAKTEMGDTFPLENDSNTRTGIRVLWLGNYGIVYARSLNIILPLSTNDVEKVCSGIRAAISNLCATDKYEMEFDGDSFAIHRLENGVWHMVVDIQVPECVRRTYVRYFSVEDTPERAQRASVMGIENNSMLGQLITQADTRTDAMEALKAYRTQSSMESLVSRDDLFIVPSERYKDTSNFYGSICYTDKEQIVVAVNFRRGLFVYYPWFPEDADAESLEERTVKTDTATSFQAFYNVTEGCNRIVRFSKTVTLRPLTAVQFDLDMYAKVRQAFLEMKLPRIPLHSSFGRIVIPESVMAKEMTVGSGESIYCLLPVGCVGSKVICLSASDTLIAVAPTDWDVSGAFYDITEVVM